MCEYTTTYRNSYCSRNGNGGGGRGRGPNSPECIPGADDGRRARFRSLSGIADAENYTGPLVKRPPLPATAAIVRGLGSAISIYIILLYIYIYITYNLYIKHACLRFLFERMRVLATTTIQQTFYAIIIPSTSGREGGCRAP